MAIRTRSGGHFVGVTPGPIYILTFLEEMESWRVPVVPHKAENLHRPLSDFLRTRQFGYRVPPPSLIHNGKVITGPDHQPYLRYRHGVDRLGGYMDRQVVD